MSLGDSAFDLKVVFIPRKVVPFVCRCDVLVDLEGSRPYVREGGGGYLPLLLHVFFFF